MYRIRSTSGTEQVFDSLEEFTVAVRRGYVAPEDEIFHQRANRWLGVNSHPHYRSAINYSGPLTSDAVPEPEPPAPQPVSDPPPVSVPVVRGQVVQRPVASRPQPVPQQVPQTVFRPQLVVDDPEAFPAPAAPKAVPANPPIPTMKSKEIPFLDLGDSGPISHQNAAPTAPPRSSGPVTPPAQTHKPEPDYLVADTGLERPLRTSSGHRPPGDDLDLLFDTPLSEAGPSSPAVSVSGTSHKAQVSARELDAIKSKAVAGAAAKPAPPSTRRAEPEDLDIPGTTLLEMSLAMSPEASYLEAPVESSGGRGTAGLMIGSGAFVMLAAGALLVWRPWSSPSASIDATTRGPQTSGATTATVVPPAAGPASATTGEPALTATLLGNTVDTATLDDSTEVPTDDRVIAAVRPSFMTDLPVAEGDLDLGTQAAGEPASAGIAPGEFARRLEVAEKQARQELATRTAGFRSVLAIDRLATLDGVTQSKAVWSGGADAIRQYRAKMARLEQVYEDSVMATQRFQHWSAADMRGWAMHQSLAEPAETSQSADLMFNQVIEGLDILASLDGQYTVKGSTIRFKNPSAGSRYLSVRSWIEQRMQSWSATPEAARPHTVNLIMQAIGDGLPAVE